jgi:hypothetical protein
MELWIEKYGSRRFGRQMVFSLASEGICRIFEWLEALARKKRGACEVWRFFRDFCSVWSGYDLIVIIFWKPRVLLQFFLCTGVTTQFIRTSRAYSQTGKEYGFCSDLISNRNPMDLVHGAWTGLRTRVHGASGGGADKRHGGTSPMPIAQALEVTGAHRRWPGRARKTRQSL